MLLQSFGFLISISICRFMECSQKKIQLTIILSNLLTLSKFSILFLCLLYSSFLYWVISIAWFLSLSLALSLFLFVHVSSSGFWCSPSLMGYVCESTEHECGHKDQRYMYVYGWNQKMQLSTKMFGTCFELQIWQALVGVMPAILFQIHICQHSSMYVWQIWGLWILSSLMCELIVWR
jgi:hypothetical protein